MQLRHLILVGLLAAACGSNGKHTPAKSADTNQTIKPTPEKPLIDVTSPTEPTAPTIPPAAQRTFERMVVVVLENTDAATALAQPYLAELAARGAYLADYYALTHPSYPNYLGMVAGSTFNVSDSVQRTLDARSVSDLLLAKNFDWKTYAQGYPGDCYLGDSSGAYQRKHVPFLSFLGVQQSPACARVVNADQWAGDVRAGALPEYALYVPDMNNNGHDTGVAFADAWLRGFLEPFLNDAKAMKGTLVVLTFDEATNESTTNRIYTVFLGPMVRAGAVSRRRYDHYSLLRTLEDNFELGTLGKEDAYARPITDVWR